MKAKKSLLSSLLSKEKAASKPDSILPSMLCDAITFRKLMRSGQDFDRLVQRIENEASGFKLIFKANTDISAFTLLATPKSQE